MSSPVSPSPDTSDEIVTCPACKAKASGKFCSNCGAALVATSCANCKAALSPGAKFCHRCGTPAGAEGNTAQNQAGFATALPWAVAGIALVAFIALVAGQRFARSRPTAQPTQAEAPFANGGAGQPPDISNLTPAQSAILLYNKVMTLHEAGKEDSVQFFAPMVIQAYGMIGDLDLDQHYDVGRVAAISGDQDLARAEADTILGQNPNHLLGLILAGNAAKMRKDVNAERSYYDKFQSLAPAERSKLPEYSEHEGDIDIMLKAKRP